MQAMYAGNQLATFAEYARNGWIFDSSQSTQETAYFIAYGVGVLYRVAIDSNGNSTTTEQDLI
jgi:hypothetical protein